MTEPDASADVADDAGTVASAPAVLRVTGLTRFKKFGIYLLFLVFLAGAGWALAERWDELQAAFRQLSWLNIAGSLVLGYLSLAAMFASWHACVEASGSRLAVRDGARIYFVGQVGKYLPGSVWPVLTQSQLGRKAKVSPIRMASAVLLSLAIGVTVSLLLGGLLLPFAGPRAMHRLWWVTILAIPLLPMVHPAVLNRLVPIAARILKRGEVNVVFGRRKIAEAFAWAILGNLIFGAHVFLLSEPLGATGLRSLVLSTCAFALASALGLIVIFLPAGAGVREAVIAIVMASVVSADAALVIALVSRALLVIVDVSCGLSQLPSLHRIGGPTEELE